MALPSGFSPFVEFVEETQQWTWIGEWDQLFKIPINVAHGIQTVFIFED